MSPEAQRFEIAKACGALEALRFANGIPEGQGGGWSSDYLDRVLPDYLTDLNAMHEAEKMLTEEEARHYPFRLAEVILGKSPHAILQVPIQTLVRPTAVQRAEAFLRTKGLWKDD